MDECLLQAIITLLGLQSPLGAVPVGPEVSRPKGASGQSPEAPLGVAAVTAVSAAVTVVTGRVAAVSVTVRPRS